MQFPKNEAVLAIGREFSMQIFAYFRENNCPFLWFFFHNFLVERCRPINNQLLLLPLKALIYLV
jgi:hypothetical protein